MAFCSDCGKQLENDVKFCSGCGKAQDAKNDEPIIPKCSDCGKILDGGEKFCSGCGKAQDAKNDEPIIPKCSNCGKIAENDEKFCSECGNNISAGTDNPVSAAPAAAPPSQVEMSSGNEKPIKQGPLSYIKGALIGTDGVATIYKDRLEWKGNKDGMEVVIKLSDIVNTKVNNATQMLTLNLVNNQKQVFTKVLTGGDWAKQLAFGYLGSGIVIANLAEWKSAIDIARGSA